VVVRGERVHPQGEVERALESVFAFAFGHVVHEFPLCGLEIVSDCLDGLRVIVVGCKVPPNSLQDRGRVLLPGLELELVCPDRFITELLLVRLEALGDKASATLRIVQSLHDAGRRVGLEGAP
jgi:hypothetical protein